ncbi:MAG: hypothetical protein H7Z42_12950 [Roseiflexaceae bacterium]|nr:hypothetical protein [Roseiflexaceae bacterium]
MRNQSIAVVMLGLFCAGTATAADGSGTLRWVLQENVANHKGVLAAAADLLHGDDDTVAAELELRGAAGPVSGIATARQTAYSRGKPSHELIVNELQWSGQAADWHITVGKKIVSWDVGYAFRPLDVVQQENRRSLITSTLEGVPVLLAERFSNDAALTIALANPMRRSAPVGRDEPAIALRGYWRDGKTDWHAVARVAQETGWRAGGAISHVASDEIEMHGSLLRAQRLEHTIVTIRSNGPSSYNVAAGEGGWQALLGATWSGENKIAVTAEAWHDERAWSRSQWRAWRSRAQGWNDLPIPASARAGLLASEADAFNVASLQRDNLMLRVSYAGEAFSPSLDTLYMPADGGMIITARVTWTGDRSAVEAGWRAYAGPAESVVRQLPSRGSVYVSASISF